MPDEVPQTSQSTAELEAPVGNEHTPPGILPPPDPDTTDPAINLTRRGKLNFVVAIAVIFLGILYYYRHYSELVGTAVANSVGVGCIAVLASLRGLIWTAVKKRVLERLGRIAARFLNSKWLTILTLVTIVALLVLFAITSSIVLTYDEKVTSPPFQVVVLGRGKPFKTLRLAISSTSPVAGQIFCDWFPRHDLNFEVKKPAGYDIPPGEPYAPYSRIRLRAPSSFPTPALDLVTIVPGPNLLSSLPAVITNDPATRYYLRLRYHVGETPLTLNLTKGVVLTGAELQYLPTSLTAAEAADLSKKFNGIFGEKLEGPSLDLVLANVVPIASPRFDPQETIVVEAGKVAKDGKLKEPIARASARASAGNQFVFLERRP
jgi:hypothetical protein